MMATLKLIGQTTADLAFGLVYVAVVALLLAARIVLALPLRAIGRILEPADRWASARVLEAVDRALGPVGR